MNTENQEKIHVLHIASADLWAGAEVQIFTLANAIKQQAKAQIEVVLLNHGELEQRLRDIGIKVNVLDETRLNAFQIFQQLIRIIKTSNPDIIHSHRVKENILASFAALLTRKPTLRTAHGAQEHKLSWDQIPKKIINFLDWFSGRYMQDKIVAVSSDLSSKLETAFPENRLVVIQNGIDLNEFSKLPQKSSSNRQLKPSTLKVGIAGRLVPVKRIDLFIECARQFLQRQDKNVPDFHIFGDGPLTEKLKQHSIDCGTENIVHFEGHCMDIHQQLLQLDVLMLTSDHEGLPMILLEAMALQLPIIAHAVGGIPELLDHGNSGILVETHEAGSYAEHLRRLLGDTGLQKSLTDNALSRIKKYYSADINAEQYIRLYQQILKAC